MRKALSILAIIAGLAAVFVVPGVLEERQGSLHLSWNAAEAQSVPDVTLNDIVYWDAVVGSAGYQVRILTASSGPFWPSNTNSNIVHDTTDTFFALSQALTGAAQAQYKFQVRAVETGGTNPTSWSQLTINYVGLSPPTNLRLTP